jgi:hypothetical protein
MAGVVHHDGESIDVGAARSSGVSRSIAMAVDEKQSKVDV